MRCSPFSANIDPSYAHLLRQNGDGPWTPGHHSNHDDEIANEATTETPVVLSEPNPKGESVVERSFSSAPNMSVVITNARHTLDIYTSGYWLRDAFYIPGTNAIEQGNMVGEYDNFLDRMRHAQGKGHKGSARALTLLHNLALRGERIAFVEAHGNRCKTKWCVTTHNKKWVAVNEIIQTLASRTTPDGQRRYGAICLNSCNPNAIPPDIRGITVPVVACLAINDAAGNGNANVFFPRPAAS